MQRAIQFVVLASVALSAALGAGVILFDSPRRWVDGLLTAIALGVTAGLWMSAWAAHAKRRAMPVPVLTLGISTLALVVVVYEIWGGPRRGGSQAMWALVIVAVVGGLFSRLVLAELLPRFRWVRFATVGSLFGAAALTLVAIVTGDPPGDFGMRALAITLLLTAAGLVVTPILHGVTRRTLYPESDDGPSLVHCPNCGHKLPADVAEVF